MLTRLMRKLRSYIPNRDQGQDLAEYSLLIGLLALVVIISVSLIGMNLSGVFSFLANYFWSWDVMTPEYNLKKEKPGKLFQGELTIRPALSCSLNTGPCPKKHPPVQRRKIRFISWLRMQPNSIPKETRRVSSIYKLNLIDLNDRVRIYALTT